MNIVVTGAGGFIGQSVVEHAVRAGHSVTAVVRNSVPVSWQSSDSIRVLNSDLTDSGMFSGQWDSGDCVIHLAADMQANNSGQEATITAMRNLCAAMDQAGPRYLVLVSSIAVLDYQRIEACATVDEMAELPSTSDSLGSYAQMKLEQERVARQWADDHGDNAKLVIVRPGLVYDSKRLSTAHAGLCFRNCILAATHHGSVPLVHVKDVAAALVAVAAKQVDADLLHIVGDNLPSQRDYLRALKARGSAKFIVPLHWQVYRAFSVLVRAIFSVAATHFIPDGLQRSSVAARMTPYTFSNNRSHELLDWQPRNIKLSAAVDASAYEEREQCD